MGLAQSAQDRQTRNNDWSVVTTHGAEALPLRNLLAIALALLSVAVVVTTLFVPGLIGTIVSVATSVAAVIGGVIGVRRSESRVGRLVSATAIVIGSLGLLAQIAVLVIVLTIPA